MANTYSFSSDSAFTRAPHYSEHAVLSQKLEECFSSCRAGKPPPSTPILVQDLDSVSYVLTWTTERSVQVDIHCSYILPSIVTNFANSTLQDIFSDVTPLEGSVGLRLKLPRSFRDKNAVAELLQSRTRMLSSWLAASLQSVVSRKSAGEVDNNSVSCSLLHPNLSAWTDNHRRVVGIVSLIPARRVNPAVGWTLLEKAMKAQASLSINAGACFSIGLSRAGDTEEPPFPRGCMDLLSNVPAKAGGPQAGREYRYLHVGIDCDFVQENLEEEETAALLDELVNLRHTLDHIVRAGLIEITTASRVGAREVVDKIREVQVVNA